MKKIALPVVILVVLVSASIYIYNNSTKGTIKSELSNFAVKDTASITKIFLADKAGNTVLLERLSQSGWRVNEKYPVRKEAIDNLLSTIKRITVKTPVSQAAFENVVRNLSIENTKIEIYTGDKEPSKVYFVGGNNRAHSGTYMLMENSSRPFLMHIEGFHGFLQPRYFINENDWRQNIVFSYAYEEIATIKVEFPSDPSNSYLIVDQGNNTFSLKSLATGEQLADFDTLAVMQYVASYKKIPFEGFEETKAKEYKDSIVHTTPMQIYEVTNRAGEAKQIKTFIKPMKGEDLQGNEVDYDLDRLYGLLDNGDLVIIQYGIFDRLSIPLDTFRKE